MVPAPDSLSLPDGFLTTVEVEPVGRWFLAHWDRLHSGRVISTAGQESESESDSEDGEEEMEYVDDIDYLRSLDPKECKDQDHYKVLGIPDLRFRATDDQIRKAYRLKVLRHHPDKRRGLGEEIREDDDYFTCITSAFEVLGNPVKRRSFDSVDPCFDDDVPEFNNASSKQQEFFATFGPVFERNARWSTRAPVPRLGDDATERTEVERFYKFWYDFESWREFSYLDEEDKEKGSDRDERRWIEKNNRIQRAEKKKDEMKRIRKLVDAACSADPRIIRFKEAEKQEKLDKKKAKQEAAMARRQEEDRLKREAEEAEKLEREKREVEEKARMDKERKDREVQKRLLKNERKNLRSVCKENDFFVQVGCGQEEEQQRVLHLTELDKLCEILSAVELRKLNESLGGASGTGAKRDVFVAAVSHLNEKLEREKLQALETVAQKNDRSGGSNSSSKNDWSPDELTLLIKAVNLFPAGTNNRWEVVASFMNQHTNNPEIQRTAKETLNKAKELQSGDFHLSSLKEEANRKAYENLEKQKKRDIKVDDAEASTRTENAAEAQGLNLAPWSTEDQKLLEQALKTYPASMGADRWEKIAAAVPNRSKKDCMKRYKEIAEVVRAKKAAQAAAAAKTKS